MAKKSWLQTHPHIKRFTYVGVGLIVAITVFFLVGRDTFIKWAEGLARSQGYEITSIVDESDTLTEETTP